MTTEIKARNSIKVWPASGRGETSIGWLNGWHSFSFGWFMDPERMGFRALRVINEDFISASRGFGMHPHEEMEILTWVLDGKIKHQDSTGNSGEIVPGDLQLMSAGTGIRHSEMNGLDDQSTHMLQIWIEPGTAGAEPGYQQASFDLAGRTNQWQLIASSDSRDGSLKIHQDASVSVSVIEEGQNLEARAGDGRYAYVHIARGRVEIDGRVFESGDAVSFEDGQAVELRSVVDSEVLLFDLA